MKEVQSMQQLKKVQTKEALAGTQGKRKNIEQRRSNVEKTD